MNLQDKRILIGIDTDSADEAIDKSLARRIDNCRVNIVMGGKDGITEPCMGNEEIPFALPSGINKTIGAYSDTTKNRIFYFNQNSNNVDGIYLFDATNFIRVVEGDLGWELTLDIHSITIINNLLSWTEGGTKYPREIDINKIYVNPSEFEISLLKTPPTFPLQIVGQTVESPKGAQNFYKKNNYYFIYRFVYENGQQSTWSPYSKMVSSLYDNLNQINYASVRFKVNELRVFREGGIDGLQYNNHIKFIDFAYANTYLGPFKLFKRTVVTGVVTQAGWDILLLSDKDLSPYGTNEDLSVTFRNDLSFSVLAATDTTRPYDEIWPCETITSADNRNMIGNTLEGLPAFDFQIGNVSQGFKHFDYLDDTFIGPLGIPASAVSPAGAAGNYMVWKNNSNYGLGVVFYNEFGQKSGVYTNQQLKVITPIDYRQASVSSVWSFNLTLVNQPPVWATHYQIVRTGNQKVTRFVQGITNDVLFVKSYDSNGNPVQIDKIIGYAKNRYETNHILYNNLYDTLTIDQEDSKVSSNDVYSFSSPILIGGQSVNKQQLITRFAQTGVIQNSFTFKSYVGVSDSIPFNFDNDIKYIIGYTVSSEAQNPSASNGYANAIYIGGVNRRGEKINTPINTNFDEAIDILIDIFNWDNQTAFEENISNSSSSAVKNVYNPSNETLYIYQKGDLLNVYYDSIGQYTGLIAIEIKELIIGRYLKLKFDKRFLQKGLWGSGSFIEIETPNTGSDDILFYEYGDCYPIENPKTDQRTYSKTDFSIFEGDTHYMVYSELYAQDIRVNYRALTDRDFKTGGGYYHYPFFSMTPDNLNRTGIWEKADGRPNVVLLDGERQTRKKDTIRYSDRYIDGASVNGTSTFYSFNQLQLDYDWGAIRKLTSQETILMANCEQEAVLVYVNKSMIATTTGSESLVISDQVLNSPRKLAGGYGCVNPESVSQYNEFIYFYSQPKGCALRYNEFSGLFDISGSYKARSYFFSKKSVKCQAGFDPIYRTQYFAFDDETIGFIDSKGQDYPNTWCGFFSFLPEKFAFIQLQLYSFKQGKIYKHESDTVNTFYGIKYPSKINVIFNEQPNYQKIANFISQETDKPLFCELVTNQEGQVTDIADGGFEIINKDWQAAVPGNTTAGLNKWEGDLISSHVFDVTFRWDKPELFRLRYLNLYSQISLRTNEPNPAPRTN